MSHPAARTDLACRNCGAQAPLEFCPECGQETTLHPPTLGEFLHEFVGHYVALEGTLWRTLALLLRHPGRLTREYLDGRRRRYVLPLRLYLTASFLLFLVLKLTTGGAVHAVQVRVDGRAMSISELQAGAASAASAASGAHGPVAQLMHPIACGLAGEPACGRLSALVNDGVAHYAEHPRESMEHMRAHFLGWAPYAIFVLLPLFAGIMMLTYRNRRMTYGEHFVFSLHLHTFWFLALLVLHVLPDSIGGVLQLGVPVYGVWAMREAYGGRWWPAVGRALFVSVLYGLALTLALAGLSLAALALA